MPIRKRFRKVERSRGLGLRRCFKCRKVKSKREFPLHRTRGIILRYKPCLSCEPYPEKKHVESPHSEVTTNATGYRVSWRGSLMGHIPFGKRKTLQ